MTTQMAPLVIIGAGDHGRVILELARAVHDRPVGFVEPDATTIAHGRFVDGLAVLGSLDAPERWLTGLGSPARFIVALGSNDARRAAHDRAVTIGLEPATLVHPTATLLSGASIAPGAQVCAGAIVGVAARVGRNVIVNTGAIVDHDVELAAHAFIGPGARLAGRVQVGERAFIGLGALDREGRIIGEGALVAAGAVVVDHVPAGMRVAGVPAREMAARSE
jgi:UDP-perosamine 4-acetyltransferase